MRSAPVVAFTHPEIVEFVELASTGKTPSDNAAIAIIEMGTDLRCFFLEPFVVFMSLFFTREIGGSEEQDRHLALRHFENSLIGSYRLPIQIDAIPRRTCVQGIVAVRTLVERS